MDYRHVTSATVLIVYTEKARASASSAQGLQPLTSVGITKKVTEFPFASARCITVQEVATAEEAVRKQFGIELETGRPTKDESERYEPVSIRLHSKVIEWAKEAAERGIGSNGYQRSAAKTYAAAPGYIKLIAAKLSSETWQRQWFFLFRLTKTTMY